MAKPAMANQAKQNKTSSARNKTNMSSNGKTNRTKQKKLLPEQRNQNYENREIEKMFTKFQRGELKSSMLLKFVVVWLLRCE
jgi:Ni/Co efflux regulator RcnB